MTHVLIAGLSTRAAAASAARAGFVVTSLDGYADRDQHPDVRAVSLPRDLGIPFTAPLAADAAAGRACDAVAYLSNFDNNPDAVAALAANRVLWGNPPDVLRRVRDPQAVALGFRTHGVSVPDLARRAQEPDSATGWLLKPISSGGGRGVRRWRPGAAVPDGCYLQQWIDGTPGSIVFLAAAGRVTALAVTRQLIGDRRFGASGYRYCGNILASPADPQFDRGVALTDLACTVAAAAAAEFHLTGVNGIDFIARAGVPFPIEINPRWTAAMELVEAVTGRCVFEAHAAACVHGWLPEPLPPIEGAFGKAIVFADAHYIAGNTDGWLTDTDIRDVPHCGETITAGDPVCTVFAGGADAAECEEALVARARRIYADMRRWRCVPPAVMTAVSQLPVDQ